MRPSNLPKTMGNLLTFEERSCKAVIVFLRLKCVRVSVWPSVNA